jgi:hypothetical protein
MDPRKTQQDNHRLHPRRAAFIIAEYTVNEGVFRDIIKSIGASGIFISTKRHIAEGQTITVKFPVFKFDHVIQLTGKVIRRTPSGFAIHFDQPLASLICKEGEFPPIVHESERKTP